MERAWLAILGLSLNVTGWFTPYRYLILVGAALSLVTTFWPWPDPDPEPDADAEGQS